LLAAVVVEPLAVTMDLAAVVQVVCLPAHSPLQLLVTRLPLERAELLLPQRQEVTTQQILMVQIRQSLVHHWQQFLRLAVGQLLLNQAWPELHQTVALVVELVVIPERVVQELLAKVIMVVPRHNPETAVAGALALQAAMEILQME